MIFLSPRIAFQAGTTLSLLILLLVPSNASAQSALARIENVIVQNQTTSQPSIQQVKIIRASNSRAEPGQKGLYLYAGDRVITGGAKVVLTALISRGNREVSIGENTTIEIRSDSVFVSLGRLWVKGKGLFAVKSTYWVLGVSGTEFTFEISPGDKENTPLRARLSVIEGAVDVRLAKSPGKSLRVTCLKSVDLIAGDDLPRVANSISPEQAAGQCSASTAVEQAKCFLRPVKRYGYLGPVLSSLPAPFDRLIGHPIQPTVSREKLAQYLAAQKIDVADLGGPLSDPVSRTADNQPARYFILHDSSSPQYHRTQSFPPAGMDSEAWPANNLKLYGGRPFAHVFINRVGQSATITDFKTKVRSTKCEVKNPETGGLSLHVQMIQPRRVDELGRDAEAPNPGFTDAQLDRLALVYVSASVRRGEWLIPAYHATIDWGLLNSHDDPQNFDLNRWASRLDALLRAISNR